MGWSLVAASRRSIVAELSRSQFLRIANAKRVEGKLGNVGKYSEFRLTDDDLEGIRKLAACLNGETLAGVADTGE
jgi:hypothetical protein